MTHQDPDSTPARQGLRALVRSDFERQAKEIGRRRVPFSEGFWLAVDLRVGNWIDDLGRGPLRTVLLGVRYPFHKMIKAVNHSGIGRGTEIGPGLLLMHFGGVWIHPDAVIGSECTIFHQVTITPGGRGGAPRIGDRVVLMAGAKVLGGVTIGDDARIGANAVVLDDVPAGALAVGSPARVVRRAD